MQHRFENDKNFDIINRWEQEFMYIQPSIIARSNRKTLSITVTRGGEVVVKAPHKLPMSEINIFVAEKQPWIQEKLSRINKTISDNSDVLNYQKLMLFGQKYSGYRSQTAKEITFDSDRILIPTKIKDEHLLKKLKAWYKSYAHDVLKERLLYIEEKIRLKSKSFKISDTRGRWGSCNSSGEININFRVIMLPPNIIDYVLVHELSHLLEMNHSKNFWATVGKILPAYSDFRRQIKQYAYLLELF